MLGENEPDAHCMHTVIALNELYVPPAQGVHAVGEDWSGLGWIVPAAHAWAMLLLQ